MGSATIDRWKHLSAGTLTAGIDFVSLAIPSLWAPYIKAQLAFALLVVLLVGLAGLYRARLQISTLDPLPRVCERAFAAAAIIASLMALRHRPMVTTKFLTCALTGVGLLILGRYLSVRIIRLGRKSRLVEYRTVLIGTGVVADSITRTLTDDATYGLRLVGFVADGPAPDNEVVPHLGKVSDLLDILHSHEARIVIVSNAGFTEGNLVSVLRKTSSIESDLFVVPRLLDGGANVQDHIGAIPITRLQGNLRTGPRWLIKRGFDIAVSSLGLLLLFPVLLVCAIAVRIEGGPGILFRQERVGLDGKYFEILKFRSMVPETPDHAKKTWSVAGNPRIRIVGRLLRRTSLDELPQLWNVLRGDMTLVGPRPERPYFVDKFSAELPGYVFRHRVPCGLTGLAQVNGLRGDTSIEDRARFDNFYIDHWSLWLDIKVLLRTLREVFTGRGR